MCNSQSARYDSNAQQAVLNVYVHNSYDQGLNNCFRAKKCIFWEFSVIWEYFAIAKKTQFRMSLSYMFQFKKNDKLWNLKKSLHFCLNLFFLLFEKFSLDIFTYFGNFRILFFQRRISRVFSTHFKKSWIF